MTDDGAPVADETPAPPAQYVIRSATVEDAVGIAETHVASWRAAYRGLLPEELLDGLSVERRTTQWQEDIRSADLDVHIAADPAGHVGGFIAGGRSRDGDATGTVGELMAIYVRPQLWSLGIGGRLHAAGVAGLATRFEQATLWVLEGNARSRAFYERQGWRPDGTVKRHRRRRRSPRGPLPPDAERLRPQPVARGGSAPDALRVQGPARVRGTGCDVADMSDKTPARRRRGCEVVGRSGPVQGPALSV